MLLMKQMKTSLRCPGSLANFFLFHSLTYQSHWCRLWPLSWLSSTSSSCLVTASAAAPPSQGAFAAVQLLVEVAGAGIVVVVEEVATAGLDWLLLVLVEKIAEPVEMVETSCWVVEAAAREVVDEQVAFLRGRMKDGSFAGWSESLQLEGQSCDPLLLQTLLLPRGSSPALTFAALCLAPPWCALCSACTWPGWEVWAL